MKRPATALLLGIIACLAIAFPTATMAHDFGALRVDLSAPRGATMAVLLTVDSEHLPPGVVAGSVEPAERGKVALEALAGGLILRAQGELLVARLVEAEVETTDSPSGGYLLSRRMEYDLPPGTTAVAVTQALDIGPFVIRAFEIEGAEAPIHWALGGEATPVEILLGAPVKPPSRFEVVREYLVLGFTHILPKGLDHILFVLGLFLLSTRWRPLLLQVSAFTVAHTLTLAASIYGIVRLSPSIVEPLIALSIAYVAIENLVTTQLKPWRAALVFAFGLLHGLGFAGVLTDLGLPSSRFLTALLSFNVGVEIGQLTVLVLAFALVGWLRDRPGYRRFVVVPGSVIIAAMGVWWFVERTFLER